MRPFMKDEDSTPKMMLRVIVALIPIIVFSFYKNGVLPYLKGSTDIIGMLYPLIFIGITTLSTFIFETLYQVIFDRKKKLKEYIATSYAYMPGIFLGLILPINTPIPILIVGAFIASIIGKMIFGGFGQNIFNPALIGRLLIISTYALAITERGGYLNPFELDAVTTATPLSNAATLTGIGAYNELVQPYGNLWNFFIGTIPGSLGETSALLCILGFIYLTITKTIKWRIPVLYVLTVFIMTFVIGIYNGAGLWYPLFQILSGGLMFGAVFMATDPVTSPTTISGQILYGISLGTLTVVLRYLTPYPEGVLTSILTMNMFVYIFDNIGVKVKFNRKNIILPIVILLVIMTSMTIIISGKMNVTEDTTDKNFEIISKDELNGKTTYVVTEVGYSSKIKLKVVITDGNIDSIDIEEQGDSFFSKVINANYTNTLIENQNDLNNCDTVSGATVSSTAVKKAIINIMKDYKGE